MLCQRFDSWFRLFPSRSAKDASRRLIENRVSLAKWFGRVGMLVLLGFQIADVPAATVRVTAKAVGQVLLTSAAAPSLRIVQQPESRSVRLGATATFTVVASGTEPLTYQWQFQEVNIPGATNASYIITNVSLSGEGLYRVRVSDASRTVTSDTVVLLVRCSYTLSETNLTFSSTGGAGLVTVRTPDECSWAAARTGEHITLDPDSQIGSGTGTVAFVVAPNPFDTPRLGGIMIGDQTLFIIQRPPDRILPSISILSPSRTARIRAPETIIRGQALDDVGLTRIEFQLNGGPVQVATGTVAWSTLVALQPGTNTLQVRSIDTSTNASPWMTRTVFRSFQSPLSVEVRGNGTISPNLNERALETDTTRILTARPAPGWVFAAWSGDANSTDAQLQFVMREGLAFAADFVPSPFTNSAGSYHGLFFETGQARPETSGQIALQVTDRGSFSCQLTMVGRTYRFAGQFSYVGFHRQLLKGADGSNLALELELGLSESAGRLTGRLVGPDWTSELEAFQSRFDRRTDPAPFAGNYTLLLLPQNPSDGPAGTGFGTAVVDTSGKVTFKGELSDGSKIQESVLVSRQGHWPLFSALSGKGGVVLGWVTITNLPADDLTGTLQWIKMGTTRGPNYPGGFTNEVTVAGSIYERPAVGERVLDIVNGLLELHEGGLTELFTEEVTLGADHRFVFDFDQLALSVNPATGLLSGSLRRPSPAKAIPFKGAVLQKRNVGGGYFLNDGLSGVVELVP